MKLEVRLRNLGPVSEMWPFVWGEDKAKRYLAEEVIGSYIVATSRRNDDERALCSSPGCGRAGRVCPRCGLLAPCNMFCTSR